MFPRCAGLAFGVFTLFGLVAGCYPDVTQVSGGSRGAGGTGGGSSISVTVSTGGGVDAGGGGASTTVGTGGGGAGGGPDDVVVTRAFTYITEQGDVPGLPHPGELEVNVLVPGDAGFAIHPGLAEADGSYRIAGVPHDVFYLSFKAASWNHPRYVVTSARAVDLGGLRPGREDLTLTTQQTPLFLTADGLSPWNVWAHLRLYCLVGPTLGEFGAAGMVDGATSVSGVPFSSLAFFSSLPLIQASKGDVVHILRTETQVLPGGILTGALRQILTLPAPELVDGQPSTLTGTFQDVPQKPLSLAWKGSAFAALEPQVNPSTLMKEQFSVQIRANPAGSNRSLGPEASVALGGAALQDGHPLSASDVSVDLTYGNPFPAGWDEVVTVNVRYFVPAAWPGPVDFTAGQAALTFEAPLASLGQAPLEPLLGPPLDVTINGVNAGGGVGGGESGLGKSPLITWKAPSLGVPTRYEVKIFETGPQGGYSLTSSIVTADTSVWVPPGLLVQGKVYVVSITASDGGTAEAPGWNKPAHSTAEAITGLLTG